MLWRESLRKTEEEATDSPIGCAREGSASEAVEICEKKREHASVCIRVFLKPILRDEEINVCQNFC